MSKNKSPTKTTLLTKREFDQYIKQNEFKLYAFIDYKDTQDILQVGKVNNLEFEKIKGVSFYIMNNINEICQIIQEVKLMQESDVKTNMVEIYKEDDDSIKQGDFKFVLGFQKGKKQLKIMKITGEYTLKSDIYKTYKNKLFPFKIGSTYIFNQ